MNEQRQQALAEMYEDSTKRGGGRNFFYVNVKSLERLGIPQYKMKTGPNFVRILPAVAPNGSFAMKVKVYSNFGVNKETFLSPATFGQEDPVDAYRKQLSVTDPSDPRIKALVPKDRYLVFVVDTLNSETEKEGIKWMDCPAGLMGDIIGLSRDRRTGQIIDVSDPQTGRDVEFDRVGKGINTEYKSVKLSGESNIPDSWWADIPDFLDVLMQTDSKVLMEQLAGLESVPPQENRSRQESSPPPQQQVARTEPGSRTVDSRERAVPPDQRPDVVVEDPAPQEVETRVREERPPATTAGNSADDIVARKLEEARKKMRERSGQ